MDYRYEDLPPEAQRTVRPGDETWKELATRKEKELGSAPGALGNPRNFKGIDWDNTDALSEMARVAKLPKEQLAVPMSTPVAAESASTASPGMPASQADASRAAAASTPIPTPRSAGFDWDSNPAHGGLEIHPFGIDKLSVYLPEDAANLAAGYGKSFVDTARGVGELIGLRSPQDIDETRRLDASLMDTGMGMTGSGLGFLSQLAIPSSLAERGAKLALDIVRGAGPLGFVPTTTRVAAAMGPAAQAAAINGGFSALQPVGTGDSRGLNTLEGAAAGTAGAGISESLGKILRPAVTTAGPDTARIAQSAQGLGMPLRTPQVSTSPVSQMLSYVLSPFNSTGGVKEFNQGVGRLLGVNGGTPTQQIAASKDMTGKVFDDVTGKYNLKIGAPYEILTPGSPGWHDPTRQNLAQQFQDVATEYANNAPLTKNAGERFRQLNSNAQRVFDDADAASPPGTLPGSRYQQMRSSLGAVAADLDPEGNDMAFKKALLGQQNILDDAFAKGMSPQDQQRYTLARQQYSLRKTLEPAAPTSPDTPWDIGSVVDALRKSPSVAYHMANAPNEPPFTPSQPYAPGSFSPADYGTPQAAARLGEVGSLLTKTGPGALGKATWGAADLGVGTLAAAELEHGRENPDDGPLDYFGRLARDVAVLGGVGFGLNRGLNSQWLYNGLPRTSQVLTAAAPYAGAAATGATVSSAGKTPPAAGALGTLAPTPHSDLPVDPTGGLQLLN